MTTVGWRASIYPGFPVLTLVALAGLAGAVLWLCTPLASARAPVVAPRPTAFVRYVAPGADCGGRSPCYDSVQAAIDAIGYTYDEILVATGVYTGVTARRGVTQSAYISTSVTIRGGYAISNWDTPFPITQPTILDAQGQGRVLYLAGLNISVTVEGLHMTGGNATGISCGARRGAGGAVCAENARGTLSNNVVASNTASTALGEFRRGGGVYLFRSPLILSQNTVVSNTADSGGGVFLEGSEAILTANTIISNTASGGGGVSCSGSAPVLRDNVIAGNSGTFGGGVEAAACDIALINNEIRDNQALFGAGASIGNSSATVAGNRIINNKNRQGYGGGMTLSVSSSGRITVENNLIVGNEAEIGAGIEMDGGPYVLRGNIIRFNIADDGGGIRIERGNLAMANNVIADNIALRKGSGILIERSNIAMIHTTIARNRGAEGSGVYVFTPLGTTEPSTLTLTNTVIVQQSLGVTLTAGNSATLDGVLWYENWTNTGGLGTAVVTNDYTGDPLFADDGYHLTQFSMAVNSGVDAGIVDDIDGEPRPYRYIPDLGADEWLPRFPSGQTLFLPVIVN